MEKNYPQIAIDYKKNIANKFALVEGANLRMRIGGENHYVTRKIDGHMQIAFFDGTSTILLNSNGKEKASGIKCIDVMNQSMKDAGLKQAVIAAELYMPAACGRPRHSDVARALADDGMKNRLRLAPFDIVELDGKEWTAENYGDTHTRLSEIFKSEEAEPVEMQFAAEVAQVQDLFDQWVTGEGAEGLVIHSGNVVWKVKPRHTIDAAVIGYTVTERGIRSLMFAMRTEDGKYQMFTQGSTGMTDEQRAEVAERLSKSHVESQYVLSDSRGIAYQMVKPELVFEISVVELVAKGNDDKVRINPLLTYDDEKGWLLEGTTPGVSAINITVDRERTDKTPTPTDVRVSQLSDLTPFEEVEGVAAGPLPASTLLERRVFKKTSGVKTMLHKFLLWKTNKEQTGRYPAYIVFHTDFSNGRADMVKTDMSFTSSEAQARELFEAEIASNIKKGWNEV